MFVGWWLFLVGCGRCYALIIVRVVFVVCLLCVVRWSVCGGCCCLLFVVFVGLLFIGCCNVLSFCWCWLLFLVVVCLVVVSCDCCCVLRA